jgi:hypothetical protein
VPPSDDDPTAPGRPPAKDHQLGALDQAGEALAAATARVVEARAVLRLGGALAPAQRDELCCQLRETGNHLRAAAVLLEGSGQRAPRGRG